MSQRSSRVGWAQHRAEPSRAWPGRPGPSRADQAQPRRSGPDARLDGLGNILHGCRKGSIGDRLLGPTGAAPPDPTWADPSRAKPSRAFPLTPLRAWPIRSGPGRVGMELGKLPVPVTCQHCQVIACYYMHGQLHGCDT